MNQLNLNLTLLQQKEVFEKEIFIFLTNSLSKEKYTIPRHLLYVPVSFFVSSKTKIVFNEKPSPHHNDFAKDVGRELCNVSIVDLIEWGKKDLPRKKIFNYEVRETIKNKWEFTKGDRTKIKRIEEEYVTREIIIPLLNKHISLIHFLKIAMVEPQVKLSSVCQQ